MFCPCAAQLCWGSILMYLNIFILHNLNMNYFTTHYNVVLSSYNQLYLNIMTTVLLYCHLLSVSFWALTGGVTLVDTTI